jgi:dGTP triphosphohydrolase
VFKKVKLPFSKLPFFMSTPRANLKKAMEKQAADMLLKSRAEGKGPLFNAQQSLQLADMCEADGDDPVPYLEAYTAQLRKMLPAKATGEELVAFMEESVKNPPPYKETVEHYQRLRNRSGGDTMETLEKCYQELLSEVKKAQDNQYSEKQVAQGESQLNDAWQQYTNCLRNLVRNKVLSDEERQDNFNKGNSLVGDGLRGYNSRRKAIKEERARKKLLAAQSSVKELLNLAEQVDSTASNKDLEYLIGKNSPASGGSGESDRGGR